MFKLRPVTYLLAVLMIPVAGTIVATADAKAKGRPRVVQHAKIKIMDQCMKNVGKEMGSSTALTVNEVCTCLTEHAPEKTVTDTYLASKEGGKAFGNCLFLAKDGL